MVNNVDLKYFQYKSNIYIGKPDILSKEIVRYTSVENLYKILKGELYTSYRKDFLDQRECGKCINPKNYFRLTLSDGSNRKYWELVDEKINGTRNLLTSCWSYNLCEDILMWKAYKASVRIKVTVQKLLDAINDDCVKQVICDQIIYKDEHPCYSVKDAMFYKECSYHNEQEIRFYFDKTINCCKLIHINADNLVDEVIVSPFISRETNLLIEFVKRDFPKLNFKKSTIIENYKY